MQCKDFDHRLHLLLDRRRRPELDEQLIAHAQICSECSEVLDSQELLFDGLKFSVLPASSNDLSEEVVSTLKLEREYRSQAVPTALLAVAATLLLAMIPMANLPSRSSNQPAVAMANTVDDGLSSLESGVTFSQMQSMSLLALGLEFPETQTLAVGLKPLASTFSAAVDAIRRAFAPFGVPDQPVEQDGAFPWHVLM